MNNLPEFYYSNGEFYCEDKFEESSSGTYMLIDTSQTQFYNDFDDFMRQETVTPSTSLIHLMAMQIHTQSLLETAPILIRQSRKKVLPDYP